MTVMAQVSLRLMGGHSTVSAPSEAFAQLTLNCTRGTQHRTCLLSTSSKQPPADEWETGIQLPCREANKTPTRCKAVMQAQCADGQIAWRPNAFHMTYASWPMPSEPVATHSANFHCMEEAIIRIISGARARKRIHELVADI